MKIKFGIYFLFVLLLVLESCSSTKNFTYLQAEGSRKGEIVNIPSYRNQNFVRFKPDDILGITVNVPAEQSVAREYNLPLIPSATTENSTENSVSTGMGRQSYLVKKDGTIDFPVIGNIKVAGYTQEELETHLKTLLMVNLKEPPVITVRLQNFSIYFSGEVGRTGKITVDKDNINILEALSLAGDMTIYGKRDEVELYRPKPDGSYDLITLDISKEDIISSPYYFLHQNDHIYVKPINARAQATEASPRLSLVSQIIGVTLSAISLWLVIYRL